MPLHAASAAAGDAGRMEADRHRQNAFRRTGVRKMKTLVLMLMLASIGLSAADAAPAKDSAPPAAVNKELLQLLQSRVNLKVSGMGAVVALRWQLQLTDIPLKIEATQTATAQKVDFALEDATLAEALR